ncbi:hypothetical protein Emed_006835 [Eimeria media]
MACNCTRPNYKGPGVGIWALALALEFSVAALMIFMGAQFETDTEQERLGGLHFDLDISRLLADGNAWRVVNILGWLHLLMAAACGIFAVLGLFVCGIFLCPLCILGWVQALYCVVSTVTTAAYLRGYLDLLPSSNSSSSVFKTGDLFFAQMNSGGLLAASVLSFSSAVVMARANRVSSGESVPGTFMMVCGMGLFGAIGAMLGVGGGGASPTPTLAALWVALTVIGAILMNVRACCCTRACNVLMIILFGVGAALSFITTGVMAHIYVTVLRDPYARPDFTHLALLMENGTGLVAAAVICLAAFVMSVFATIYAARTLFCCGGGVTST